MLTFGVLRSIPTLRKDQFINPPVKRNKLQNDWKLSMGGEGEPLENLVATHLLKRLHFIEDYYYSYSLRFIRYKEGCEVNFVTIIDGRLSDLIEVKASDGNISTSLKYYKKLLNPERTVQIVRDLNRPFDQDGIRVTNPIHFFTAPPWHEKP
jgi:predicted AAA+ superfamily ATPase